MATITLRPNAAGDLTELENQFPASGAHWDKVDEAVADEDTTYIYPDDTQVGYGTDLYNLESFPTGTVTITNVAVTVRVRKDQAAYIGYFYIEVKTGGIVYESSIQVATTAYADYTRNWTTNPQTGVAWTASDINALQAGVKLRRGVENLRATQVYIVVTYTTVPGTGSEGYVWQETTKLHWIDENGAEQSKEGTVISTSETPAPPANLWFENFLTSQLLYVDMSTTGRKRLDGVATGVTGQPKGTIWVEGADLHGIDETGAEIYIEGG